MILKTIENELDVCDLECGKKQKNFLVSYPPPMMMMIL